MILHLVLRTNSGAMHKYTSRNCSTNKCMNPVHLNCVNCLSILLIILIWCGESTVAQFETVMTECPKQCICSSKRMSCEQPGLKHLPHPYMLQLEYLLIQNQTFDNNHLGQKELQMYTSSEYGGQIQLKSLHIRYCNIASLGRHAFQTLGSELRLLDLTGNPILQIAGYTFAGLDQLTLILDEIPLPKFSDHTFTGLTRMKSLIMRHNGLIELPYQSLEELVTTGRLNQLLLKGNKLQYLDRKFEVIFSALQNFEINDNPWHCDCRLNWLIRRYRKSIRLIGNDTFEGGWTEDLNQPLCDSPPMLKGHKFNELITDLNEIYYPFEQSARRTKLPFILYCPPPKLQRLDIDLSQFRAESDNSPITQNTNNSKTQAINLKCVVKGSEHLTVNWNYQNGESLPLNLLKQKVTQIGSLKNAQITNSLNPGTQWSLKFDKMIEIQSILTIMKYNDLDIYTCMGYDIIGNISATVRLQWPSHLVKTIDSTVNRVNNNINNSKPIDVSENIYLSQWSIKSHPDSDSILHMAQFSLGELIAAIAGTFLSTVLLFFIIHQVMHRSFSFCKMREKRYHLGKADAAMLGSNAVSPGGTSSSNTSCSVPKNISVATTLERSLPTNTFANSSTGHFGQEGINLTSNLMNSHAYHQLYNVGSGLNQATLPINMHHPQLQQHQQHQQQQQSQAELSRQFQFPTSTIGDDSMNSFIAYEPVSYSDVNNVTYDVPWLVNTGNNSNNSNQNNNNKNMETTGNTLSPKQLLPNEHMPLLLDGNLTDLNHVIHVRQLPNPLVMQQSNLMIPPPPSIPQPSLPTTGAPTTDLKVSTMRNAGQLPANMLFLQTNYPTLGANNYLPTSSSNPSDMNTSTSSGGIMNYRQYQT